MSSASGASTSPAPDASTISASDAPATVPAVPFTYAHPNPMFAASMPAVVDPKLGPSQPSETGVVAEPAAAAEDEKDDTDFWRANEIQDVEHADEEDDADFKEANEIQDVDEM
jgi:hypothetical protein